MYSPVLGQFTQRDPMGYAAGDENLYRYVDNDPTDRTDPTGLMVSVVDPSTFVATGTWKDGTAPPRNSNPKRSTK